MPTEPDRASTSGGSSARSRLQARRIGLVLAAAAATVTIGCAGLGSSGVEGAGAAVSTPTTDVMERADVAAVQIRAEVRDRTTGEPLPTVSVPVNSEVELVVDGDPTATLHLIGYNHYAQAENGSSVLRFVADRVGRFVVERDETGVPLAEVEVFDPDTS